MWQKYTAVTVHDSTPLRKISVGMPFKVKLELHLECTPGHRALARVLSDDVMLSKPPCRRQDGKQELQTEKCEKTEIGGDGWDVSGRAGWKHVVLLADFFYFFKINNLLKHDRTVCLLYWHNCWAWGYNYFRVGKKTKKKGILIFSVNIFWALSNCSLVHKWAVQSGFTSKVTSQWRAIPQVFPASTQSVEIYRYANVKNQNKRGLYQQPPTAPRAFKGNLEDREDAEVSRKQPYLACSLNRRIMLLLGWRVKGERQRGRGLPLVDGSVLHPETSCPDTHTHTKHSAKFWSSAFDRFVRVITLPLAILFLQFGCYLKYGTNDIILVLSKLKVPWFLQLVWLYWESMANIKHNADYDVWLRLPLKRAFG